MIICHTLEELRRIPQPVHWAMGCFDGVHCGHQCVIRSADTPGALRGVLTFEPHPLAVLSPEACPGLLTPLLQQKAELLEELCGVDVLLVLEFSPTLAATSPAEFLNGIERVSRIAGVSVGENWHFGRGGEGDANLLREEGKRRGFRVRVLPLQEEEGGAVSSRRVRAELTDGNIALAERLLGHPFSVAGRVEHGRHLARQLGFPTANIPISPAAVLPPYGVYRVSCRLRGRVLSGIANLGLRPTVAEQRKSPRMEVHFPGLEGDLYGQFLTVLVGEYLRAERQFSDLEALREQIARDVASLPPCQNCTA